MAHPQRKIAAGVMSLEMVFEVGSVGIVQKNVDIGEIILVELFFSVSWKRLLPGATSDSIFTFLMQKVNVKGVIPFDRTSLLPAPYHAFMQNLRAGMPLDLFRVLSDLQPCSSVEFPFRTAG
jgi:hypothetical protein